MQCLACRTIVENSASFCTECGKPLRAPEGASPSGENPFHILGLAIDVEIEVVRASYKALARKYHPDLSPGANATRKMQELNWANDELERDLAGWKRRLSEQKDVRTRAQALRIEDWSLYANEVNPVLQSFDAAAETERSLMAASRRDSRVVQTQRWNASLLSVGEQYGEVVALARGLRVHADLAEAHEAFLEWAGVLGEWGQLLRMTATYGDLRHLSSGDAHDRLMQTLLERYKFEASLIAQRFGLAFWTPRSGT